MLRKIMDCYWANFILKKNPALWNSVILDSVIYFENHGKPTWILHFTFHFTWSVWYANSSMSVSMPLGVHRRQSAGCHIYLSVYLSIYLSIYRSIYPSVDPSIHPYIHRTNQMFWTNNISYAHLLAFQNETVYQIFTALKLVRIKCMSLTKPAQLKKLHRTIAIIWLGSLTRYAPVKWCFKMMQ